MLGSVKLCLISQQRRARKILEKLKLRSKPTFDFPWFASMEVSSQLKQVFKFMDTNGDGKLSPLELKKVILRLGDEKAEAAAANEAEGIMREMDCNGDGFVDLDEFMIVMENNQDSGKGVSIMEAFRVFDADNNGFISAQELKRVLRKLGCGNCSVKECRKMIKGVDRDGDGFVNFEDFKLMMSAGYY